jgi:4'-phosphopantetheinyl transferase
MHAVDAFGASLSRAERERAAAFRFERHRAAYVVAHGVLREVVARYLETDAAAVEFDVTDAGRPFVAPNGKSSIDFNLSHAGDAVVVAVARDQKVGVDVEEISVDIDHVSLARRFFAPGEIDQIGAADAEAASTGFFECWTKKEAIVKAVGRGLSMPLASFCVSVNAPRQKVPVGEDGTWAVRLRRRSGDGTGYRATDLAKPPLGADRAPVGSGPWRAPMPPVLLLSTRSSSPGCAGVT